MSSFSISLMLKNSVEHPKNFGLIYSGTKGIMAYKTNNGHHLHEFNY
jgi:hypothetical protein